MIFNYNTAKPPFQEIFDHLHCNIDQNFAFFKSFSCLLIKKAVFCGGAMKARSRAPFLPRKEARFGEKGSGNGVKANRALTAKKKYGRIKETNEKRGRR